MKYDILIPSFFTELSSNDLDRQKRLSTDEETLVNISSHLYQLINLELWTGTFYACVECVHVVFGEIIFLKHQENLL